MDEAIPAGKRFGIDLEYRIHNKIYTAMKHYTIWNLTNNFTIDQVQYSVAVCIGQMTNINRMGEIKYV